MIKNNKNPFKLTGIFNIIKQKIKKVTSKLSSNTIFIFAAFSLALGLFTGISSIPVQAQGLQTFNILQIGCLFEGQPVAGGGRCAAADSLLSRVIGFLTALAAPLALFVLIWGGYQYFIGGIDGKTNGKNAITAAITGLVIVLIANLIISTVTGALAGGDGFNPASIISFIKTIINAMVSLASVVALLVVVWGGYKYFFSGLGFEKEGGAKSIRSGLIGLIVVFISYSLFDTIVSVTETIAGGNAEEAFTVLTTSIISPFITSFRNILISLSTGIAVIVIIIGGYKYFLSGAGFGKEDGRKSIQNGIIGLATIFLASGIINVLEATLNVAGTIDKPIGFNEAPIISFITVLVSGIMLPVSTGVAVFFFVLAGFKFVSSGGESKKIEEASKALKNAIIGLVVVLLSGTLTAFIRFILGAGIGF